MSERAAPFHMGAGKIYLAPVEGKDLTAAERATLRGKIAVALAAIAERPKAKLSSS